MPTLATVGTGLAWFSANAAMLVFVGAGVYVGMWVAKRATNFADRKLSSWAARRRSGKEKKDASTSAAAA